RKFVDAVQQEGAFPSISILPLYRGTYLVCRRGFSHAGSGNWTSFAERSSVECGQRSDVHLSWYFIGRCPCTLVGTMVQIQKKSGLYVPNVNYLIFGVVFIQYRNIGK